MLIDWLFLVRFNGTPKFLRHGFVKYEFDLKGANWWVPSEVLETFDPVTLEEATAAEKALWEKSKRIFRKNLLC